MVVGMWDSKLAMIQKNQGRQQQRDHVHVSNSKNTKQQSANA
jgi:hypothetical protein